MHRPLFVNICNHYLLKKVYLCVLCLYVLVLPVSLMRQQKTEDYIFKKGFRGRVNVDFRLVLMHKNRPVTEGWQL